MTADLPHLRWTDASGVDERVARTRRVLDFAAELGVRVVTTSIGAVTHPETGEPSPPALEILRQLCEHADKRGRMLSLRPTYDAGERLHRVFRALNCANLKVTLDPAVLVMTGARPEATVEAFANDLALVYGRDGTAGGREKPGEETRVGAGDVDFPELLAAMEDAGYRGVLMMRRVHSRTPLVDLEAGKAFLARFLG
jgi:sugar phosphate isomerase/epimerase